MNTFVIGGDFKATNWKPTANTISDNRTPVIQDTFYDTGGFLLFHIKTCIELTLSILKQISEQNI